MCSSSTFHLTGLDRTVSARVPISIPSDLQAIRRPVEGPDKDKMNMWELM